MKELHRRGIRLSAAVLVLGLVATACGGDDAPIRIAVNAWTGSAANANVAKILLERELGATVELVDIDEFAQFPALGSGDLDATLEVWPSGHAADYETYITGGGGVVDGGELGVIGDIGWWIPTYLLEEHPEFATWEGLQGNESLFATAETGDAGQFLAGDPSFVTYDEQIIASLGLNFEVVYSGSEAALITAMEGAFERQEPILLYFYTPQWAHEQFDLTQVQLPPFDEECAAAAATETAEGYDCDYADDNLYKAFNEGLEERAPEAFQFLSAMSYSNDDQNLISFQVNSEGTEVAAAAQAWIDANADVWGAWLP